MNNFDLPTTEYYIVWDKGQKLPSFAECELAWSSIHKPAKILFYRFESGKCHPAQKPVELFKSILTDYSKETDTILDPFLGSGTTARAAKDLGRKWIGIEISKKYCDIAVKRLGQEVLF